MIAHVEMNPTQRKLNDCELSLKRYYFLNLSVGEFISNSSWP